MTVERDQQDHLNMIGSALRVGAWDVVKDWLEHTDNNELRQNLELPINPDLLFDQLPTLIGGIAKILGDPVYLADLEQSGELHEAARHFGAFRFEVGFPIDKLLNDITVFRRTMWNFCRATSSDSQGHWFDIEHRMNLAVDLINEIAVRAYYDEAAKENLALSQRDKLTGFLHARAFGERLKSEIDRSKRYIHPLILLRTDIDHFRDFNERNGRLKGNSLLRNVAREIGGTLRRTDLPAHLGADDFAVIMPETDIKDGKTTSERIRHQVRSLTPDKLPVTLSIGVAGFPDDADDQEQLIAAADQALLRAKEDGGDVVRPSD